MKLVHLGYYQADYPSLGLADVDPAAEVEIGDPAVAAKVMVEGVFAPGDAESKKLLVDTLTAQAIAEDEARVAREQAFADENARLQAEAAQAQAEQQKRREAAMAEISAAREAAVKAAKKAAGKVGE